MSEIDKDRDESLDIVTHRRITESDIGYGCDLQKRGLKFLAISGIGFLFSLGFAYIAKENPLALKAAAASALVTSVSGFWGIIRLSQGLVIETGARAEIEGRVVYGGKDE